MRSTRFIVILTLALVFVAQSADARPTSVSKRYETDKKLGVGVMLGLPMGLSSKYMLTDELAVDLGLGAIIKYRDRTGFHAHLDFMWHPFVAVEGESFLAPFYFGLGTRFLAADGNNFLGVRVPFGISFDLHKKSFDIFVEGALVYDFSISGDGDPGAVDINALTGLRFYIF